MGFFKELKRLFKGYDLTGGAGNEMPMNREQRRAQEKMMRKKQNQVIQSKRKAF